MKRGNSVEEAIAEKCLHPTLWYLTARDVERRTVELLELQSTADMS